MAFGDWLRRRVKRSPLLYPTVKRWKHRAKPGKFCTPDKDLCIAGHPSSANTFTYHLLQALGPGLNIAHRCHAVSDLKAAKKHCVPTVMLVRHPADTVASVMVRFGFELDSALLDYIDYHRYVVDHLDDVHVVLFEEITNGTAASVGRIEAATGLSLTGTEDMETVKAQVIDAMRQKKQRSKKHFVPDAQSNEKKARVIASVRAHRRFPEAEALYSAIVERTERSRAGRNDERRAQPSERE